MSIIYDALKKVEGTFKDADTIDQKVKSGVLPKSKTINRYAVIIVVSCVGFLTASWGYNYFVDFIVNSRGSSPVKGTAALKQPVLSAVAPIAVPAAAPAASAVAAVPGSTPAFVLNGVFYSADQGYALVNNQIVREGDVIGGMTVTKIASNEVELKAQDSIVKLATNSR